MPCWPRCGGSAGRGGRVAVADLTASPDPEKAAAFHRMEMLRDPSHARALTLDEFRTLFRTAGFATPAEAYWRMKIDVDELMPRSFPAPGHEAIIRQMFEDAVDGDAMGLDLRRERDRLRFDYSNVILTALREP